ncbi:hypothetical protein FIS3754_23530 [Fischerella sp. NIES-3754]|nr:hypothetical protein FIS3754_23530 [Fischerella sp. NIES-3754]
MIVIVNTIIDLVCPTILKWENLSNIFVNNQLFFINQTFDILDFDFLAIISD